MDVCLWSRQVHMRRMNEEQLLHRDKCLTPLGVPGYTLIRPDKACLGTAQLSAQSCTHKSKLCPQKQDRFPSEPHAAGLPHQQDE